MNAELGKTGRAGETTQWLKAPAVLREDPSHQLVKSWHCTIHSTLPADVFAQTTTWLQKSSSGSLSLCAHHTYYLNLNLNKHTYKISLSSFSPYAHHQFLCSDPPHLNNSNSFLGCLPYFLPLRSNPFSILLRESLFMDITRLS